MRLAKNFLQQKKRADVILKKGGYLWKQVMQHMCADVMVDLVEDAIVPVNGGQASPQVAPLLQGGAQVSQPHGRS